MSNTHVADLIEVDFFDTPMQRLSDSYHYKKLKLAEETLLPKAKEGNVLAIQSLLYLVSEAINDGARVNKKIANYLSKAFVQIYYGEKADLALGIVRSRGQKSTRLSRQKAYSIAFFIEETEEGTLEEKFEIAADKFLVSADTAKKAWQKNYKEARRIVALNKKNFSIQGN